MSITLYRKYRPQTWDEMTGQEVIVQTLRNEIATGRLAHAYLFSGPRGVGKTTVARLLAKALNCERRGGADVIPCGSCVACTTIAQGRAIDVIEIDAASHTGVDMVREHIIENAQFLPTVFKTKVFIIDEVHMLSSSSFNALLKTLEEPPAQVYFILATTELHKVPETVASRCQRFDFKRIPAEAIGQRLSEIAKEEKVKAGKDILDRIAARAEGSLRDAESIFGQILALGEKEVTENTVDLVLPRSDFSRAIEFIEALLNNEPRSLDLLQTLAEEGADFEQFGKDCLTLARALLLASATGATPLQIIENPALRARIKTLASRAGGQSSGNPEDCPPYIAFIDALRTRIAQIPSSPIPSLPLELLAVERRQRVLPPAKGELGGEEAKSTSPDPSPNRVRDGLLARRDSVIPRDEEKEVSSVLPAADQKSANLTAVSLTLEVVRAKWDALIEAAREANHSFPFILKTAEPTAVDGGTLTVTVPYPFHRDQLSQPKIKAILSKVAEAVFGAPLAWNPVLKDELRVSASSPAVAELLEAFGGHVVE